MIILLALQVLFQIIYDHWGQPGTLWDVIYFSWQYGWVAAVAFHYGAKTGKFAYICFALIFSVLAVNELTYLLQPGETYLMMTSGPPAYLLTVIAVLLFVIHEIKTKWKSLSYSHGQS